MKKLVDGELNPNHPTTIAMRDQWHKIAALMMLKFGVKKVEFTEADIEKFSRASLNIAVGEFGGVLQVWLVGDAEAESLARQEGGLPV